MTCSQLAVASHEAILGCFRFKRNPFCPIFMSCVSPCRYFQWCCSPRICRNRGQQFPNISILSLFDRLCRSCFSHPSLSWPYCWIERLCSTASSRSLWGVRQGAVKVINSDLLHFPLEQARGSSCIKLLTAPEEWVTPHPAWVTPQEISSQRKAAVLSSCVCIEVCSTVQLARFASLFRLTSSV